MSARGFGQIIEVYMYGDARWVTIWDLEKKEQYATCDTHYPPFVVNQFVAFERNGKHFAIIRAIQASELPSHLMACI